ncbi:hypothetical protein HD806DRAFT_290164 [Xylariaceae sp. AK1471]|nr:hypothetical protein HD806DRAFT_290164 [Xylariaceae sp. AK1471]
MSSTLATGDSPSWQNAVDSYLSRLKPAERGAFKAPASAQECIALLTKTQRRKTKLMRILDLLRPALDPLKRFEGAIDVVVQVNAGIASPIWGPLRVVITLAANYFSTLESIVMIIHRIISSLQRFSRYEELFTQNELVQNAIGALYCDYLDFCVRVAKFYSTSSLKTFFANFEKDFREVSESIQLHSQNVDWAAQAAHMEETQRETEKYRIERQAHERGNIHRWLSPATVEDDFQKHLGEYMDGSCDWLHDVPQFSSWISVDPSPQPVILGIEGRPGSGKSTMATYIVNYLRREKRNVVFFFFKANHTEKESIVGFLRTIISQLLRIDHHNYEIIEPYYQESGRAVADLLAELQRGVLSIIRKLRASPLFLVLDALDESSDQRETLEWLFNISSFSSDLRILLTTRPTLSLSLNPAASYSVLTLDTVERGNINKYIKTRVERNPILRNSKLGPEVASYVSDAANGLWLYARLMMDDIDRSPSDGQVLKQMKTLPKGFTELYTRILKTNEISFTPIELKLAQQLYLWLDVEDYMPRFLEGINEFLGFPILKLVLQYANDGEPVFDPIATAHRFSGSLIEVSRNPDSDASEATYEIDFIHATAEQYLHESTRLPMSQLPLTLRPQRHRYLHRAMTAMWYFTECDQSRQSLLQMRRDQSADILSVEAYFEMAYGLWNALHLVDLDISDDAEETAEVTHMLQKLSEFISSRACLRWIEAAIIINYENRFPHLLWNAIRGWESGQAAKTHRFEPYAAFSRTRIRFCRNYAYVLTITGVGGGDTPVDLILQARRKFEDDTLAREIMKIGRRWKRLIFDSPEQDSP